MFPNKSDRWEGGLEAISATAVANTSKPISTHHFSLRALADRYMPFLILAGIAIFIAVLLVMVAFRRPNAGIDARLVVPLCFLVVGGAAGAVAVYYTQRVQKVEIHEDRLAWIDADGEHEYHWEDITSVHRMETIINGQRHTTLTIRFGDGKQVAFTHALSEYDALALQVQALSASAALSKTTQQLDKLGVLSFGAVQISRAGVNFAGDFFPWQDLDYGLVNGHLVLSTFAGRKSKPLEEIPNYFLMLELMSRVGKPKGNPADFVPEVRG